MNSCAEPPPPHPHPSLSREGSASLPEVIGRCLQKWIDHFPWCSAPAEISYLYTARYETTERGLFWDIPPSWISFLWLGQFPPYVQRFRALGMALARAGMAEGGQLGLSGTAFWSGDAAFRDKGVRSRDTEHRKSDISVIKTSPLEFVFHQLSSRFGMLCRHKLGIALTPLFWDRELDLTGFDDIDNYMTSSCSCVRG